MKKAITVFLVFVVMMSSCFNAFAVDNKKSDSGDSYAEETLFDTDLTNMTDEELNSIIDTIAMMSSEREKQSRDEVLRLAWLAFAQILRNHNYPLTATLIEHSVDCIDYYEYDEDFADAIQNEAVYSNYMDNLRSGQPVANSLTFNYNSNQDLFYSLHNVSISNMQVLNTYFITISDVYDFLYDSNYDSLIAAFANNGAWLSQQKGALYPIYITIQFIDT